MRRPKIPEAAIKRLPVYLRVLEEMQEQEVPIVSSAELAERTGFSPEQIRKDLAYFGAFGTRGVGYDTALLRRRISRILGLHQGVKAALVGAGHLGYALARYSLSKHKDVQIAAIFDVDPLKVGTRIGDVVVRSVSELEQVVRQEGVKIGIVAVPASEAQRTVDALVSAGVEAILNFAPAKLKVPEGVFLQNIDLTIELQSLAYYTSASQVEEDEVRVEQP
ncbi:redox-sensing transcriptional repressor Rex [Caldinitratiruptor microaerophilus]|uniref:Redox-sensing transcriptional repressor Rex n=1 Tax=Caldinitratiruptor microaerophilus TaxID=671077 RepID=A0AA35CLR6_9FIRM|nr:redox-sensing transcriptional repressor Rex [Caldinitratiruptor microaerophilus]BDG61665.1 redox-sensing transcriptional repressor Rex [Caldinitratiruptor microaerophilus]